MSRGPGRSASSRFWYDLVIRRVHPGRASVYGPLVLDRARALLSLMDREPLSRSYGSFDRDHWAWKFRDFPLGMMQSALYPLALLWRYPIPGNAYCGHDRVLEWIIGGLRETIARQHRNGAFDAFAPNEQDPGPTMGVAHAVAEAFALIDSAAPSELGDVVRAAVQAAAEFSLRRNEQHAFVSNHQALIAVAFHTAGTLLGEARFVQRAEELADRVLEMQSADGWYSEYGGPDPGYESLGIFHLATLWRRTGQNRLLESLRRSVECFSYFVHPDGSVGGQYGARNTSLFFPGGFEVLAAVIPAAAGVAAFMRERLGRGNVVSPEQVDAENLPALAYTYLEACLVPDPEPANPPPLPCQELVGTRQFEEAGVAVRGTDRAYVIVNGRKGGVCRVFDRAAERLAYEDAGYVLQRGRRSWVTQRLGAGAPMRLDNDCWQVQATFQETRQVQATPASFVILRLLNLTLFRSLALGQWIRTLIVRRLITRQRPGPFRLRRDIAFRPDRIVFTDHIERVGRAPTLEALSLPRSYSTVHMGSAKYFHPAELDEVPAAPLDGVLAAVNRDGSAEIEFSVAFSRDGADGPQSPADRAGVA